MTDEQNVRVANSQWDHDTFFFVGLRNIIWAEDTITTPEEFLFILILEMVAIKVMQAGVCPPLLLSKNDHRFLRMTGEKKKVLSESPFLAFDVSRFRESEIYISMYVRLCTDEASFYSPFFHAWMKAKGKSWGVRQKDMIIRLMRQLEEETIGKEMMIKECLIWNMKMIFRFLLLHILDEVKYFPSLFCFMTIASAHSIFSFLFVSLFMDFR